jgi:hypothetical protein
MITYDRKRKSITNGNRAMLLRHCPVGQEHSPRQMNYKSNYKKFLQEIKLKKTRNCKFLYLYTCTFYHVAIYDESSRGKASPHLFTCIRVLLEWALCHPHLIYKSYIKLILSKQSWSLSLLLYEQLLRWKAMDGKCLGYKRLISAN